MSSEKLRRENNRFDITFVLDPETNEYTLEKPLPKGLKPEDFVGHICELKYSLNKLNYKGESVDTIWYGTVEAVNAVKITDANGNFQINPITVIANFRETYDRGDDTRLIITYYPNGLSANYPDKVAVISSEEIGYSYGPETLSEVVLQAETDQNTGDVTYSGTGYIHMRKNLMRQLVADGYILTKFKDNVGVIKTNNAYNKICMYYSPMNSPYDIYLKLSSYWIYPADQVVNPSVVVIHSSNQLSDRRPGYAKYDIQVSFTVPAANLKTYPNI